jgi:hypothetical protein
LQNADDAEARRIRLDALPGWPTASNPLLRGSGLLVVNDGQFRESGKRGIISFGESDKAADSAAIGKFGFGQKAVFHLCDAFIACARSRSEHFSVVVNPFLGVEVNGNVTQQWEPAGDGLAEADRELLQSEIPECSDRHLVLWLPFRRRDLMPAPELSFSSYLPSPPQTIADLCRPRELCVLLTMLRHVASVEIREGGQARCAISLNESIGRLLGPKKWRNGTRSFNGELQNRPAKFGRPVRWTRSQGRRWST